MTAEATTPSIDGTPGNAGTDLLHNFDATADTQTELHPIPIDFELTPSELGPAIEAILIVADEPIPATVLAQTLHTSVETMENTLQELAADYQGKLASKERGFVLRNVAGGWRFYSSPSFAHVVGKFVLTGQTSRLTQAALETLAVIAYKQPISRVRIGAIRGVNVDSVVRTLAARGLIEPCGQEDSGAVLYQTTAYFLERLGINALEDLPPLAPFLPALSEFDTDSEIEAW